VDKHTPEWTYEVHQLSEGYSGIVYDEHGQMVADHLSEERACLIADAPDLLEALESIRLYANDTLSGRTDGPDDRAWQRAAVIEIRNRARAAISKANGVIHG